MEGGRLLAHRLQHPTNVNQVSRSPHGFALLASLTLSVLLDQRVLDTTQHKRETARTMRRRDKAGEEDTERYHLRFCRLDICVYWRRKRESLIER